MNRPCSLSSATWMFCRNGMGSQDCLTVDILPPSCGRNLNVPDVMKRIFPFYFLILIILKTPILIRGIFLVILYSMNWRQGSPQTPGIPISAFVLVAEILWFSCHRYRFTMHKKLPKSSGAVAQTKHSTMEKITKNLPFPLVLPLSVPPSPKHLNS